MLRCHTKAADDATNRRHYSLPVATRTMELLFNSRGRLGVINFDGSHERYLSFDIPEQVSWGFGPQFADNRHVILVSYEEGKSWEGNVRTHLWLYDRIADRLLAEIATEDRPAPFMSCSAILPGEKRLLANPIIDGIQQVWSMNIDGSDSHQVTSAQDGFTYCVTHAPDFSRLAFHATMIPGQSGYRVFTADIDGGHRTEIAGHADHLYFGPAWSPDGSWLIYQDCHHQTDPGHDWADLCLGRPDGTEHHIITSSQSHWFGTSYGAPDSRGGGSNMSSWSPNGEFVTYTRSQPDSRTAWPYQSHRPDEDHFNRDYHPDQAQGGSQICLLSPFTGDITELTTSEDRVWDFRTSWSSDGKWIAFCRAPVGEPTGLWVMDANGGNAHMLTGGYDGKGADHPIWAE